jgi:hypothetical protein
MTYANTHDLVAQLADDLDVAPCVAATVLDSLLIEVDDEAFEDA